MKQVTLNVDDATFQTAELRARESGKSLTAMLVDFLRSFGAAGEDEFARMAGEEAALRAGLTQQGRRFSAQDRLNRAEVHERDALR